MEIIKSPDAKKREPVELDSAFRKEVMDEPLGESIKHCFQCGVCTASCPVGRIEQRYNPRRIIKLVLMGARHEVLDNEFIWLCSLCYTCQERCPQGVMIPEVMVALKNIAVSEGRIPKSIKRLINEIKEHGRVYRISEFDNRRRSRMNLPHISEDSTAIKDVFWRREEE